jgi:hypothetical protein
MKSDISLFPGINAYDDIIYVDDFYPGILVNKCSKQLSFVFHCNQKDDDDIFHCSITGPSLFAPTAY